MRVREKPSTIIFSLYTFESEEHARCIFMSSAGISGIDICSRAGMNSMDR